MQAALTQLPTWCGDPAQDGEGCPASGSKVPQSKTARLAASAHGRAPRRPGSRAFVHRWPHGSHPEVSLLGGRRGSRFALLAGVSMPCFSVCMHSWSGPRLRDCNQCERTELRSGGCTHSERCSRSPPPCGWPAGAARTPSRRPPPPSCPWSLQRSSAAAATVWMPTGGTPSGRRPREGLPFTVSHKGPLQQSAIEHGLPKE